MHFLLFVINRSFHTMQIFGCPASWLEGQNGFDAILLICYFHCTILFDPHFADNYIMNTTVDVGPSVGLVPFGQFNGDNTFWLNLDAFAPKLEFWMNGAAEFEIWRVSMEWGDWRVMRDLLTKYSKIGILIFVRFTQQRIERFAQAFPIWCQRGYSKSWKRNKKKESVGVVWSMALYSNYQPHISCARRDLPVQLRAAIDEHTPYTQSSVGGSSMVR